MQTLVALVAVLALALTGSRAARATETETVPMLATAPGPIPTSMPVILGKVTSVSAHSVTVATARAEAMTLEIDSRTVAPSSLVPGDHVQIEFHLLDNGQHFARRITPLEAGSAEYTRLENQLTAWGGGRQESPSAVVASSEPSSEGRSNEAPGPSRSSEPSRSRSSNPPTLANAERRAEPSGAGNESKATGSSNESVSPAPSGSSDSGRDSGSPAGELPRTASDRDWLLVAGLGAVAAALGYKLFRRS